MNNKLTICIFIAFVLIISSTHLSNAWWDTAWPNRKNVTLTGTIGAGTNIPLYVVKTASMQSDFSDLRFTNSSENMNLSYWIESWNSTTAKVWVNMPGSMPNIIMYYGNNGASSASNKSAILVTDAGSVTLDTSGAFSPNYGMNFTSNYNLIVKEVGQETTDSSSNLSLYSDAACTVIQDSAKNTSSKSFNYTGDYIFTTGTSYCIQRVTGGAVEAIAYKQSLVGVYPSAKTGVTWASGTVNGGSDTDSAYIVKNISTIKSNSPQITNSFGAEETTRSILITLNSPADASTQTSSNILFNVTATVTAMNITNLTFFVWDSNGSLYNTTYKQLSGNTTNTTTTNITGFNAGNSYIWNAYGCSIDNTNFVLCNWAANNRTFDLTAFVMSGNYTPYIYSTDRKTLHVNLTLNPLLLSAFGYLWIDGVRNDATATQISGADYSISKSIDAPAITNAQENKTIIWQIIGTTATGTSNNNVSFNWTINKPIFTICQATTPANMTLNVTVYDVFAQTTRIKSKFKSNWQYWLGGGNTKLNYSYDDQTENANNFTYCITPNNSTITFHSSADIIYSATGYSQNYYYYNNASLTNSTTQQDLYLLNTGNSTLTELKVLGESQQGLSNQFLYIQLYDAGTGIYKTVAMAKTNQEGRDYAYLAWYDYFYKFLIVNNGTTVGNYDPYKIAATPQTFNLRTSILFPQDKFKNVQHTLYFNNATNNFVLTYLDPSGLVSSNCLRITQTNQRNYSVLYDQCLSTSSGTLSYNIGASNGTFLAEYYALGSNDHLDSLTVYRQVLTTIYTEIGKDDATVYHMLVTGTAGFLGLFSPVVAIVALLAGYAFGYAIGFGTPDLWMPFIGIAIIGVYFIWKMRN